MAIVQRYSLLFYEHTQQCNGFRRCRMIRNDSTTAFANFECSSLLFFAAGSAFGSVLGLSRGSSSTLSVGAAPEPPVAHSSIFGEITADSVQCIVTKECPPRSNGLSRSVEQQFLRTPPLTTPRSPWRSVWPHRRHHLLPPIKRIH